MLVSKELLTQGVKFYGLSSAAYDFIKRNYRGGMVDCFQRLKVNPLYTGRNLLPQASRDSKGYFTRLLESYNQEDTIFITLTQRIIHMDIRSSYPASMMDPFGVGELKMGLPKHKIIVESDGEVSSLPLGFYEVEIETPENAYGLLYHRSERKGHGKLKGFKGNLKTVLHSEEIKYFTKFKDIKIVN